MAHLANEHAVDGLDGIWLRIWDDCPVMAAAAVDLDRRHREWEAENAWMDTMMRSDGVL